jgi:peptidoglycan hydrolase CwlO-like protein
MFKKIFVVLLSSTIISCPLLAQTPSTETATGVKVSTGAAGSFRELNSAIAGVNYKIEYLNARNNQLNKDMDDLRGSLKEQKNSISELNLGQPQEERIKGIETELSLVRTDLAQLKEDVGVAQSSADKPKPEEKKEWYQAEWVAPTGLGISVLALLIAVFRK